MLELEELLSYKVEKDKTKRMLFRDIINKYHKYKDYKDYPGRKIDYFVKLDGKVIGVIGIASPMLAISARDNFIGWNKDIRIQNLQKVANNYRFCMIERGYGGKALSLLQHTCVKDWQAKYGYRLLMLETMVEPPFTGNVYKSAGWMSVGSTKGQSFKRRASKGLLLRGSKKRAALTAAGKYEEGNYKHCGKSLIEQQVKVTPKIILLKPLHRAWKLYLNKDRTPKQSGV